jgi:CubicO group peptidase (beta-lactamase class C family)
MRIRRLAEANTIFQGAVDIVIREKGEVGLQVAAYLDGQLIVDVHSGTADLETGRSVDQKTLFPVFSVVKAVTAVALHIQAERGLIDYEAPIARYWPEFAANGKDKATIRDALSHRLGIPQMPTGVTPELMSDYRSYSRTAICPLSWKRASLSSSITTTPGVTTRAFIT